MSNSKYEQEWHKVKRCSKKTNGNLRQFTRASKANYSIAHKSPSTTHPLSPHPWKKCPFSTYSWRFSNGFQRDEGAFSSDRDISQAHRQSRELPREKYQVWERERQRGRREKVKERDGGKERNRERENVFIMSGIGMMPHWGLLVSLYIQWQLHQLPSVATMQSSQLTMAGRSRLLQKTYLL